MLSSTICPSKLFPRVTVAAEKGFSSSELFILSFSRKVFPFALFFPRLRPSRKSKPQMDLIEMNTAILHSNHRKRKLQTDKHHLTALRPRSHSPSQLGCANGFSLQTRVSSRTISSSVYQYSVIWASCHRTPNPSAWSLIPLCVRFIHTEWTCSFLVCSL